MSKLKDIAKMTGLSVSTVSRALHDSFEIGEETKLAVAKAASLVGYRAKKDTISKTIGLIVPDIQCNYYSEMVVQLQKQFEKKGYYLIMAISGFSIFGIVSAMEKLITQDICGIIVTDCYSLESEREFEEHQKILKCPIPIIRISQNDYFLAVDTIKLDEHYGTKLLVDYLYSLGHRKIGYIGEYVSDLRYHHFRKIMDDMGLDVDEKYIKRGKERAELGGYLRTLEFVNEVNNDINPATAVIVGYDQVAIGVYNALSEKGISVPQAVSVVSYDDMILNNYLPVPLTSISFPTEELCKLTAKILLNNINNPLEHVIQNVSLQPTIMVRESAAKV